MYEAAVFPTDPETTDGAAEDDHTDATTDGAAEDATTDDGGARIDGSQPKRQRKDWRPIVFPPSRRKLLKWTPTGIQRRPNE